MPFVDITLPSGTFSICYDISTPTSGSKSADVIDPSLPTILFIHSGYIGRVVFELQFADKRLRRFNLVVFDQRGFGDTVGDIGYELYTPTESARDVEQIITKLDLPPCHLFALSNGCTVALEFTEMRPDLVLSVCLCSPLPPVEPEDVASGLLQIHDYWMDMCNLVETHGEDSDEVREFVVDIAVGTTQLLFNNEKTNRLDSLSAFAMQKCERIWSGTEEAKQQARKTCVEWLLKRKPWTDESLKSVKVPVSIIHCTEDVAYPVYCSEDLKEALERTGNSRVSLHQVPAAHYGCVTNPGPINKILYDTVTSCHPELLPSLDQLSLSDEDEEELVPTPFTESIEAYGYNQEEDSL
ncbi:hypothetical protein D9613_008708 [Agrocybe pediades]|uniref:AB hydrolase-1 domain-containing protein n=1 Tax=Agrocybe pediades TaxID=84607 RepID=A0A8H4QSK3_9AGAR|nr:hypothetical protein D9613_008708 [Agrocybe pediades]